MFFIQHSRIKYFGFHIRKPNTVDVIFDQICLVFR